MPRRRTRRSRLSWIRWFWSDFDGGVKLLTNGEVGQYIRLLHLQLDSGPEQAIPSDRIVLARVLGEQVSEKVLLKFDSLSPYSLRNLRLADEYALSQVEYQGKIKGPTEDLQTNNTVHPLGAHTAPKPEPEPEPERKPERTDGSSSKQFGARKFQSSPWYETEDARWEAEKKSLRLTREITELTGEEPTRVWSEAQEVPRRPGQPALAKVMNPSNMSPERLAATILDLEDTLETVQRRRVLENAKRAEQARKEAEVNR